MTHPNILDGADAVLVVIDIQDPLLKTIHEADRVVENTIKLVEAAKIFNLPILVPLQYASRLGDVTKPIADVLPSAQRFDKMTFSCLGSPDFLNALNETGRKQVILCGIESHVCVNQTAHDLLMQGFKVHVIKDAVSSRTAGNWITSIEKMRDSGCVISSVETAIFELTQDSSSPEFKKILPIVK
ncbi:MAG: hydrolase [Armatimonadota bacterium]|nr:hydrolase [bacterium]